MFEFGRKLAEARRKNPRDDIISLLVNADLTQREFDVYFVLLATAGNETTRHTITHGLLALLDYPDQMERLRRDPSLFKPAADEMLRWATAVHYFRRTTTEDTVLADTEIPAGAKVTTWLVSGNRDEDGLREPGHVRRGPRAEQAHGVRPRRHPPLPRRPPGAARSPHSLRGDAQARGWHRAHGPARAPEVQLLQRHQTPARAGDPVISLRRIDHVSLRVTDVEDATRRWCAQFGLVERERDDGRARLACDDEPFSLELVAAEAPGIGHVAYELRRSCTLDDARRHFEDLGVDYEERDGGLEVVDPEGNRVLVLPYREPELRWTAHARPAKDQVVGHPRKLGHVNFLDR